VDDQTKIDTSTRTIALMALSTLCRVRWSYRSVFESAEHEFVSGLPKALANVEKQEDKVLQ